MKKLWRKILIGLVVLALPLGAIAATFQVGGVTIQLEEVTPVSPATLADGEHTGLYTLGKTAGEPLAKFDLVYGNSDGAVYKASAVDETTCPAIGVVTESATVGQEVTILRDGYYRDDAGLTFPPGSIMTEGLIYTGLADGSITNDISIFGSGNQAQIIGWSYGPQTRYINPNMILIEVP